MAHRSLTILNAIKGLGFISPIKLTINGIVVYDDKDGDETKPLLEAVKERWRNCDKYVVVSMKIEVVSYHHSVVTIHCEKKPK